jgi:hypothetical protein
MLEDEPRSRSPSSAAAKAAKIKRILCDPTFFPELSYLLSKLTPICSAIYAVEGNTVTLGDGYYVVLHLEHAMQTVADYAASPDLYYSPYYDELDEQVFSLFTKRKVCRAQQWQQQQQQQQHTAAATTTAAAAATACIPAVPLPTGVAELGRAGSRGAH